MAPVYLPRRLGPGAVGPLFFAALQALGPQAYSSTILADHPIGWWQLNEALGATTAVDLSGSGYNGTYVHAPVLGQTGPIVGATAAKFTPGYQQYVQPSASLIYAGSNITIESWVYLTAYPAGTMSLIGCANGFNSATNDKDIYIDVTGHPRFYVFAGSAITTGAAFTGMSLNAWHHVVATADGTNLRMYVDGVNVASVAAGATFTTYTVPNFWIAAPINANGYTYANGTIAQVALYNYALTARQVAIHYGAALPVQVPGLPIPATPVTPVLPRSMGPKAVGPTFFAAVPPQPVPPATTAPPGGPAEFAAGMLSNMLLAGGLLPTPPVSSIQPGSYLSRTLGPRAVGPTFFAALQPPLAPPSTLDVFGGAGLFGAADGSLFGGGFAAVVSPTAGATSMVTATVTAPSLITPTAVDTTAATEPLTAASLLTPVAVDTTAATQATTAASLLTPIAVCTTAATATVTTTAPLTPSAICATAATEFVTAAAYFTVTAVDATAATESLTAATLLSPTAVDTTAATELLTAVALLTPVAVCTTAATCTVTVPGGAVNLTPAAVCTTAAVVSLTAPVLLFATPTMGAMAAVMLLAAVELAAPSRPPQAAVNTTSAKESLTAASLLTPAATDTTAATGRLTAATRLTPTAVSTTAAVVSVTAATLLSPVAVDTTSATELLTIPAALTPTATDATAATCTVTVPAGIAITPLAAAISSATVPPLAVRRLLWLSANSATAATSNIGAPTVGPRQTFQTVFVRI